MAKASTKVKKTRAKKVTSVSIREHAKKDHSPVWDDCESWTGAQFTKNFRDAMQYYNLEFAPKDLKPAVIKWMKSSEYDEQIIKEFKKTKDWRCSSTMGGIASCLLRGMPARRDDFNGGRSVVEWLGNAISDVIKQGKNDIDEVDEEEKKSAGPQLTIQDRMRETAIKMAEEIDDAIERLITDPDNFDSKSIKVVNLLKTKQVKAAHARVIKDFYKNEMSDYVELSSGNADDELKEAYKHRSKKQIKTIVDFYNDVISACDMLAQEAKVTRKPRVKKPVAKDKLVAKVKFKKSDDALKLVSVNPTDVIGSKELWVFNTKTRKLGKYVADDMTGPLTFKGASLVGFDEHKSIQKTIRKPEEKLKEFKNAGKVALRTFLDTVNATDTKLNGRINEETILLKVS